MEANVDKREIIKKYFGYACGSPAPGCLELRLVVKSDLKVSDYIKGR